MSTLLFDYQKNIRVGLSVLLVGVGGFLLWAATAPIDSASMAMGRVVAESRLKTLEHLEGGIIERVYVREGDQVKAGDVLMELASDQAQSRQQQLQSRLNLNEAKLIRLQAEQADGPRGHRGDACEEGGELCEGARLDGLERAAVPGGAQ